MAEKTAGKELKKGFYLIIISMLAICIIGLTSLILVRNSLNIIQKNITLITDVYQPLIKSTERINSNSLEAEISLMRYIAEYDKDTALVSAQVKRLESEIEKSMAYVTTQDLKDKLINMSIIIKKIEKTVRLVATAENWNQKDELVENSFRSGEKMITLAREINEAAYKDIGKKIDDIKETNQNSIRTSNITTIILFIIFILTIINCVIIFRWWNRFQE
ncbi:hypothetical protein HY745_02340 [Candidatus Desantisbacteria bacterium]|nr:hypothetical protein [Candidatus Desantisbacteria bacterium]